MLDVSRARLPYFELIKMSDVSLFARPVQN
jgi:hypothetical protein